MFVKLRELLRLKDLDEVASRHRAAADRTIKAIQKQERIILRKVHCAAD